MEKQFRFPIPYAKNELERYFAQWLALADKTDDSALAAWMRAAALTGSEQRRTLEGIFGNSTHLTHLLQLHPQLLKDIEEQGVDACHQTLGKQLESLWEESSETSDMTQLMRGLRIAKGRLALLTAVADLTGRWGLEQVTGALSDFAQRCITLSVNWLLRAAAGRKDISLSAPQNPALDSGLIVLGMGKLGGRELNYSSDIDLILLFERGRLNYQGPRNEQHFMNKLAHDLVQIMQERTADGYVFRTDLRLRPDPASTPPAVSVEAAHYYYESVGQNWERAAMIKARPVGGDIAAGEQFLQGIGPFMWRRSLDFASINDIHSIKRQMDSTRSKLIQARGHNIKLGLGGIREIEFFVQIHQLIWGGREPVLRLRATCEALSQLVELRLVDEEKEETLRDSYQFLRTLEHRLQMVADEQTHTMPERDAEYTRIACFMGYANVEEFTQLLLMHLERVHSIYASSFQSAEKLGDSGNLVFTGVSQDPDTLETLRQMGYLHPETVSELVMGWHHGSRRSTRTKRARELLTELMPALLGRLGATANPDSALLRFHEFLGDLPAGVQLFSLFSANPHLLDLIADIMGSAPTLAEHLSKAPELLDVVLYEDFYDSLPSKSYLQAQWKLADLPRYDFEARMNALRRFRNEKQFQAGVHILRHMVTAPQASRFLSDLADVMIEQTLRIVTEEFEQSYGRIEGARFAIIGLGKLGSQEMTFSSDVDLVFIYSVQDFEALSNGEKSFTASVYYNRLAQRLLNAFGAMTHDGRLYEVDTRLRPSGKQGLLAVSTQALSHYFSDLAWTFEFMALTKARAVAGEESLKEELDDFITQQVGRERDMEKLRLDVIDMRERTEKEFSSTNIWDLKYVRGGLMDIDFIAQYLLLRHAPSTLGEKTGSASKVFGWLKQQRKLDEKTLSELLAADQFLVQLFNMLRLCCDEIFVEDKAPEGLKKLLCDSMKEPDFASLKQKLIEIEQCVHQHYVQILQIESKE
jgi:glutamate-ammonia-ligase adenylyltransferase